MNPDTSKLFGEAGATRQGGDIEGARRLLEAALAMEPNEPQILQALAQLAMDAGDVQRGRELFERLVALAPDNVDWRLNLADAWLKCGAPQRAKAIGDALLARMPHYPPIHFLLGQVYWAMGEFEAAFTHYDQARLDLVPVLFGQLQYFCQQRLADADWRGFNRQAEFLERNINAGLPVWQPLLPMLTSGSPEFLAKTAKSYAEGFFPPREPMWTGERRAHDGKIRVGFVTAELMNHPVAHLMAGPLENFDRETFEIVVFSHGPAIDDPVRRRILDAVDEFHDVAGLSDEAAAALILERQIDIAVTLNGFANLSRAGILAHRPAPVQVNMLGYPGSMASPYIDYIIADRAVLPAEDFAYFAERAVWMPEVYQPTDDKAPIARTPSRQEERLPTDAFVFMAYNIAFKVSPMTFEVWMRILKRTPGSVLWLPAGGPATAANFRREAQARGVDPARLVFAERRPERAEHIARHRLADLFLDTLPYNAHSTASDALWAGLPVISCRGTTFPGRVCASLLGAAGLDDLVTGTLAEYEELAVALAADPERLKGLRERVEAARGSALFDTARYTRHLEDAFRQMHARSVAREPAKAFAVEPRA